MSGTCNVCHERGAEFRCIGCHKPVCDACAFKDANGAFCSRACAAKYRDFRESEARVESKGGGLGKVILILIVLAAIAAAIAWMGLLEGLM